MAQWGASLPLGPSPGPDSVLQGTGSQPLPPKAWFRVNNQSWPAKGEHTHKEQPRLSGQAALYLGFHKTSQLSRMTCAKAPRKLGLAVCKGPHGAELCNYLKKKKKKESGPQESLAGVSVIPGPGHVRSCR